MCTVKFSIELNTLEFDDKDPTTNSICEKSEPIFKFDDALVRHQPVYVRFLDDSPVHHPPGKVLRGTLI